MVTKFVPVWKLAVSTLNSREKSKLLFTLLLQFILSLLDLLGILLSAVLAYLAILSIGPPETSSSKLGILNGFFTRVIPQDLDILTIICLIVLCIVIKDLLSILIIRKMYQDLARHSNKLSAKCINLVSKKDWLWIKNIAPEEFTYALTDGMNAVTIGFIGNLLLAVCELFMLFTIVLLLTTVDLLMVVFALIIFGTVAYLLNRILGRRMQKYGASLTLETTVGRAVLVDTKTIFRELRLQESEEFLSSRYMSSRSNCTKSYASSEYNQQLPKYLLEISAIVGMLLLYIASNFFSDSFIALQKSFIFFVASSRIVPSLLRLQGYWLGLNRSLGYAETSLPILQSILHSEHAYSPDSESEQLKKYNTDLAVSLQNVSFKYSDSDDCALSNINLDIARFETVAIVGESGAGKSTLCDIISGITPPTSGVVEFFGLPRKEFSLALDKRIVYLPQGSHLVRGTVLDNVCLKVHPTPDERQKAIRALENASIYPFILGLPQGIETVVGENGIKLSGGQMQRVVLARTIFAEPELIILDEPTNSLDKSSSTFFEDYLLRLKNVATIVIVTHKEPDVNFFNKIYHVKDGSLILDAAK